MPPTTHAIDRGPRLGSLRILPTAQYPLGHHVVLRLDGDAPIAGCSADRRIAASVLLGFGEKLDLLAFGFADTHAHCLVRGERRAVGELIRRVELSLHHRLRLRRPFEPARIRPIEDVWHLYRTFWYVLKQAERHAPGIDPLHDGSSLPDLLGARCVSPNLVARVFAALPRLERAALPCLLGLEVGNHAPVDLGALADAAAAAFALPSLRGRCSRTTRARRAAVHAAPKLAAKQLAQLLEVSIRCVEKLRRRPADSREIAATSIQLRMRTQAEPQPTLLSLPEAPPVEPAW